MFKPVKTIRPFFLLIIQVTLTILVSVTVVYVSANNRLDKITFMNDISIQNFEVVNAEQKIRDEITAAFLDTVIHLKCENDLTYDIKLSDIASPDFERMMSEAQAVITDTRANAFLKTAFLGQERDIPLRVKVDRVALLRELELLSELVDVDGANAEITIQNGQLVKHSHVVGRKMDINSALEWIESNLDKYGAMDIALREQRDIFFTEPSIRDDDINDIDTIISEYETDKKHAQDVSYLHIATESIDNILVRKGEVFSFTDCLVESDCNVLDSEAKDSYDQVASTLYSALIFSGISKDSIQRTQREDIPDFISPGFEASVEYGKKDLRFSNSFNGNVVILSQINNDTIKVFIAGNSKMYKDVEVIPETIEEYVPGNVTLTNSQLPYGETRVINPGKKGRHIRINRYINKKGRKEHEVFSDNIYKALDRTVEIGTYSKIIK